MLAALWKNLQAYFVNANIKNEDRPQWPTFYTKCLNRSLTLTVSYLTLKMIKQLGTKHMNSQVSIEHSFVD